jgi:CheY-like chemotaxis protein
MIKGKKLMIVLVDDDRDDRLLFEAALSHAQQNLNFIAVESCSETMEFLEATAQELPDLMFIDLNMPDKDGFTCIKEIKNNKLWSAIPVFVYSTSNNPVHVKKAREIGATGYLKKPNDFKDLCRKLEELLSFDIRLQPGFIYNT